MTVGELCDGHDVEEDFMNNEYTTITYQRMEESIL
jgi:hypothetical protein